MNSCQKSAAADYKIYGMIEGSQTWGFCFNCAARIDSRSLCGRGSPESGFVGLPQSHGHGIRRDGPCLVNGLANVDLCCDQTVPTLLMGAASAGRFAALIGDGPMMTEGLVAMMSMEGGLATEIVSCAPPLATRLLGQVSRQPAHFTTEDRLPACELQSLASQVAQTVRIHVASTRKSPARALVRTL